MESSHLPLQSAFAQHFAQDWIAAWNAHDLERILSHYATDVVLTSPVAQRLLQGDGNVRGIEALRDYFSLGLTAIPDLHFELIDAFMGLETIVLHYINRSRGNRTAEVLLFNAEGKVARVWANYNQ